MEDTALWTSLLMNVLVLMSQLHLLPAEEGEASLPLIVPTSLQLFEYSSVSIGCEGFKADCGRTVMRRTEDGSVRECVSTWETSSASVCAIKPAYLTDSGEYWCESAGERSNMVNITITSGAVILESPAVPVMEGDAVTLLCRTKMTSSAHIAEFFRDDFPIGSGSTGEKTIRAVSKTDEGLYKCSISDFGESAQSWLAVRARHRQTRPLSPDVSCQTYLILRTIFTVLMVTLLVLLVGLFHFGKIRITHKYECVCKVCEGKCQSPPDSKTEETEQ